MGKWRGAALGGGVMLAVASVGLVASNTLPAAGAGTAEMRVSPVSQNIPMSNQTFNVTIEVRDVNNLGSTEFTIRFDNDLLEYIGTSTGPFLTSTGRTPLCQGPAFGPYGESPIEIANRYGALRQGCNTDGLITDGVGAAGPSGSGLLATLTFKPKALGLAHIDLVGLGAPYVIYPAGLIDPPPPPDDLEAPRSYRRSAGVTGLGEVEVCRPVCDPVQGIAVTAQGAVVNIFDPNAPTPSAVPATPTKVPPQPTPNARATLTAAGLTGRERPSSAGSGGGTTGSGTTGSGRAGTVAGASGNGAGGSNGASGALGPDGAPIAGYGPQQQSNPWPERTGAGLAVAGLIAIGSGLLYRRRRVM